MQKLFVTEHQGDAARGLGLGDDLLHVAEGSIYRLSTRGAVKFDELGDRLLVTGAGNDGQVSVRPSRGGKDNTQGRE